MLLPDVAIAKTNTSQVADSSDVNSAMATTAEALATIAPVKADPPSSSKSATSRPDNKTRDKKQKTVLLIAAPLLIAGYQAANILEFAVGPTRDKSAADKLRLLALQHNKQAGTKNNMEAECRP